MVAEAVLVAEGVNDGVSVNVGVKVMVDVSVKVGGGVSEGAAGVIQGGGATRETAINVWATYVLTRPGSIVGTEVIR